MLDLELRTAGTRAPTSAGKSKHAALQGLRHHRPHKQPGRADVYKHAPEFLNLQTSQSFDASFQRTRPGKNATRVGQRMSSSTAATSKADRAAVVEALEAKTATAWSRNGLGGGAKAKPSKKVDKERFAFVNACLCCSNLEHMRI